MSNYRSALRYAFVLDQQNYRDLVHNAYIYHFNKTGNNIFQMNIGYILRCVKFMWRWNRSNETFNKEFVDYVDEDHMTLTSPDIEIESKEGVEMIRKRVASYHSGDHRASIDPKLLVQCMGYLEEGYSGNEIGEKMGVSFQTASNYKKKIRKIVAEYAGVEPA